MYRFLNFITYRPNLGTLYFANFLLALHYFLVIYINSSFLESFIDKRQIGFLYTVGSIINLLVLLSMSRLIRRVSAHKLFTLFLVSEITAIAGMALSYGQTAAVLFFILHQATAILLPFCLDLFLEKAIDDETFTGRIRTTYLTLSNTTLLISPLIIALVLGSGNEFYKIYSLSALFLIPVLVVGLSLKKYGAINVSEYNIWHTARSLFSRKDIKNIIASQFVLQLFFAFAAVYVPLHLHSNIGLPWSTIGVIFTFMLLPYILFEIPIGKLADTRLGEKEILSTGFVILAVSVAAMAFISTANPIIWALVLFMTRVGGSFIEATTESYFFKHVRSENADIISVFRMTAPMAYILSPLVASLALFAIPFQYIFILIGVLVLVGLPFSLSLKDTK